MDAASMLVAQGEVIGRLKVAMLRRLSKPVGRRLFVALSSQSDAKGIADKILRVSKFVLCSFHQEWKGVAIVLYPSISIEEPSIYLIRQFHAGPVLPLKILR